MSLILDALKRAERERALGTPQAPGQPAAGASPTAPPTAPLSAAPQPEKSMMAVYVLAALLAVAIMVIVWLVGRSRAHSARQHLAQAAAQVATPAQNTAPSAATNVAGNATPSSATEATGTPAANSPVNSAAAPAPTANVAASANQAATAVESATVPAEGTVTSANSASHAASAADRLNSFDDLTDDKSAPTKAVPVADPFARTRVRGEALAAESSASTARSPAVISAATAQASAGTRNVTTSGATIIRPTTRRPGSGNMSEDDAAFVARARAQMAENAANQSAEEAAQDAPPMPNLPTGNAPPRAAPEAPALQQMPENYRAQFPQLAVDIHVYDDNPAKRFVMIEGRRYHEGDTLSQGPQVLQIVPEGMVLDWQGKRVVYALAR